ncbi:MAG TPA: response regulator [Candidatus Omnitrophota bacterium]|nr:response regulator [Candidatus Omnitrophota bacterium]
MSKKILFVDDEPMVVALMQKRLASRGFIVETAFDGKEALQKAKDWKPDLILLDVIMPEMNGYDTCRQLKAAQETAHIPVVFFTASQDSALETNAKKVGATKIVQKPFVDQVFQSLAEILGED